MNTFEELMKEGEFTPEEIRNELLEYHNEDISTLVDEGEDVNDIISILSEEYGMPPLDGGYSDIDSKQYKEFNYLKDVAQDVNESQSDFKRGDLLKVNSIPVEPSGVTTKVGDANTDKKPEVGSFESTVNVLSSAIEKHWDRGSEKIFGLGAARPVLGILRAFENMSKEAGLGDEISDVGEWISSNEEYINKKLKELGYDDGSGMNPANIGEALVTILPAMKATKLLSVFGVETSLGGAAKYGTTEKDNKTGEERLTTVGESVKSGLVQGGVAAGAVGAVGLIGTMGSRMFSRGNRRLYDNMVSEHKITQAEQDSIMSEYADQLGVHVDDLDWDDKTRALVMGSDKAAGTFDYMIKNDTKVASNINDYFRDISADFKKNLHNKGIEDLKNISDEVSNDISNAYKEFEGALNTHFPDVKVYLNTPDQLRLAKEIYGSGISKDMRDSLSRLFDSGNGGGKYTASKGADPESTFQQSGNLVDLIKFKKLIDEKARAYADKASGVASNSKFAEYKQVSGQIQEIIDSKMPDVLKPMKKQLDTFFSMKAQADEAHLFTMFKDRNIKEKDIKSIMEAQKAVLGYSSYSKMIKLFGKNSEKAEQFENAIIGTMLRGNEKEGVSNFVQVMREYGDLNFKTKHGKDMMKAIESFSKAFKNMEYKFAEFKPKPDSQGLTINPLAKISYELASEGFSKWKGMVGITSKNKARYITMKLGDVMSNNKMPKGLTIAEQGKVAAYSNVVKKIQDIAKMNPEELESGAKGGYDSSFMFGQERLGKQNFTAEDIADNKTFDTTGWFHDKVDDRWKFHIKDSSYKIKMPKGKVLAKGEYKLNEVIDSKELFESYPELAERKVVFENKPPAYRGWYSPSTGDIGINVNPDGFSSGKMYQDIKKTLTHELQHSIQGIEGFAKGTNEMEAGSYAKYSATHGEVEARGLTKGKVGTNPQELYDDEYSRIAYDPFESIDELKKKVVNRRGVPVGSDKSPEVIK